MKCDHVLHHIDSFVRSEVDEATAERIREHLTACGACRSEEALARRIAEDLRALRRPAPAILAAKVLSSRPVPARRAVWFTIPRSLAASLLIGATVWMTMHGREMLAPPVAVPTEAPPSVSPASPPSEAAAPATTPEEAPAGTTADYAPVAGREGEALRATSPHSIPLRRERAPLASPSASTPARPAAPAAVAPMSAADEVAPVQTPAPPPPGAPAFSSSEPPAEMRLYEAPAAGGAASRNEADAAPGIAGEGENKTRALSTEGASRSRVGYVSGEDVTSERDSYSIRAEISASDSVVLILDTGLARTASRAARAETAAARGDTAARSDTAPAARPTSEAAPREGAR